jgi:hypothetical protein
MRKQMEAYSLFGIVITVGGLLTIVAYALRQPEGSRLSIFTASVLLAFAAATVGALLGFTFGIPKTVAKAGDTGAVSQYTGNTNYDQISDWLTKILVGAGLVELSKIGSFFAEISSVLGPYYGTAAPAIIPTIIITYAITGFLTTYLWARLYLIRQMQETEVSDDPEFNLSLMNTYLYGAKPRGFTRVLEIATASETLLAGEGRFWLYRACAYGQKYAWSRLLPNADAKELDVIRAGALDAVTKTLTLDEATQRATLVSLWKPTAGSRDDDLAAFRDDPDFKKLLEPGG